MSSMYDLPGLEPPAAVAPAPVAPARPRLRVVPDVPLDFDAAVRTLTPRLVRYAARRLGNVHEAEELVQEALLRAYKHRAELLTEDDVAAWSTCVTGRLVIDRLRVRGRSTSVADVPEGARVGRDTADVVVARDEARTALDALDAMPPRQAAVLWAREVEGLGYDEIGARFGMTEPAVRSILTRARKALRKEYASRGGTLPAGGLVALAPWTDGFSWLERLREAMGRAAAPAALSVVGAGLLGGVLLVPGATATAEAPAAVPATTVTLVDSPAALHKPLPPARSGTGAPTAPQRGTATTTGPADAGNHGSANLLIRRITAPACSNTDGSTVSGPAGAGQDPLRLPVPVPLGGELGVGDSDCAQGEAESRYEVRAPIQDPTGLGANGVVVWAPGRCAKAPTAVTGATTPTSSSRTVRCTDTPADEDQP